MDLRISVAAELRPEMAFWPLGSAIYLYGQPLERTEIVLGLALIFICSVQYVLLRGIERDEKTYEEADGGNILDHHLPDGRFSSVFFYSLLNIHIAIGVILFYRLAKEIYVTGNSDFIGLGLLSLPIIFVTVMLLNLYWD